MGIDGNLPLPPEVLAAGAHGRPQYFLGIEGSANKVGWVAVSLTTTSARRARGWHLRSQFQ